MYLDLCPHFHGQCLAHYFVFSWHYLQVNYIHDLYPCHFDQFEVIWAPMLAKLSIILWLQIGIPHCKTMNHWLSIWKQKKIRPCLRQISTTNFSCHGFKPIWQSKVNIKFCHNSKTVGQIDISKPITITNPKLSPYVKMHNPKNLLPLV